MFFAKLYTSKIVPVGLDTAWEIMNKQGNVKDPSPTYLALYDVTEWASESEESRAWRASSGWAPCVWDWCRGLL